MTDLLPCPFCNSNPETPFENLRDSDDMEDMVKVWTIHHHCRGIDMWIEGDDSKECEENWNRRSGVARRALTVTDEMVIAASKALMNTFIKKWFLGSYKGPVYLDCVNGEKSWEDEARAALTVAFTSTVDQGIEKTEGGAS